MGVSRPSCKLNVGSMVLANSNRIAVTPFTSSYKESTTMLPYIKELLQNAQLREKMRTAANQAEAIKLLIASAEKGYNFTVETVSQKLADLTPMESNEL